MKRCGSLSSYLQEAGSSLLHVLDEVELGDRDLRNYLQEQRQEECDREGF